MPATHNSIFYRPDALPDAQGLQYVNACALSLQFNVHKSHCIATGKAGTQDTEQMKSCGQTLQWCQSIKYLRVHLMAGNNFLLGRVDVAHLIQLCKIALRRHINEFNASVWNQLSAGYFGRSWLCWINATPLCGVLQDNAAHHHHTTTVLRPFFRDHPGEPVPKQNFWTLWCKGRLTEADTPTIRLVATPSGLSSAHLHHPPFFTGWTPFLLPNQQCQSTEGSAQSVFNLFSLYLCWSLPLLLRILAWHF